MWISPARPTGFDPFLPPSGDTRPAGRPLIDNLRPLWYFFFSKFFHHGPRRFFHDTRPARPLPANPAGHPVHDPCRRLRPSWGSLSAVEILVSLYFGQMRLDPARPDDPNRDRFLLSKGHAAPCCTACWPAGGILTPPCCPPCASWAPPLQGHPHMAKLPGLDCSSGSLGQGLSIANGLALAARRTGRTYRTYCLLGDGELQEGQVWEAAMTAAHFALDTVCAIVDDNGVQLDGPTCEVMNVAPPGGQVPGLWLAGALRGRPQPGCPGRGLPAGRRHPGRPTVLLARTVKGKGVSFMEGKSAWHGKAPNDQELAAALAELAEGGTL